LPTMSRERKVLCTFLIKVYLLCGMTKHNGHLTPWRRPLCRLPYWSPLYYTRYFFLYLIASESTIGMVLVQENNAQWENIICYLIKGLSSPKLRYSHVEKLSLVVVYVIQRLCNYTFLWKSIVVSDSNPMKHILSHHIIGGKYSKWILILKEFELDFVSSKSNKS
jgi:hypothetical protein